VSRIAFGFFTITLIAGVLSCSKTPAEPTPSCSVSLPETQRSVNVGAEASVLSFSVSAPSGCSWTASVTGGFMNISSGAAGAGSGSITVNIAKNDGGSRAGGLTVGSITASVTQAATSGCAFEVTPATIQVPAGGGEVHLTVGVTQGTNCAWTAGTSDSFLTIAGGAAGIGNGTVRVAVAANSGGDRTGQVIAAGQTVNVSQDGPGQVLCDPGVTPRIAAVGLDGGEALFAVGVGATCSWTASSPFETYLSIMDPGPHVGPGTVRIRALPNPGTSRMGNVVIAGRQVTVHQPERPGACSLQVLPTTLNVPASAATATFTVRMLSGTFDICRWQARSVGSFARVVSETNVFNVDATVAVDVDANPGFVRTTDVQVLWGHTIDGGNEHELRVLIDQAGIPIPPCQFTVSPTSFSAPATVSTVTVTVTEINGRNCPIALANGAAYFSISTNPTGTPGVSLVTITIAANPGAARSSFVVIAGQTVTISQAGTSPSLQVKQGFEKVRNDMLGAGRALRDRHLVDRYADFTRPLRSRVGRDR